MSLIGGCHADEPVGPRLLRHLAAYLRHLPREDPLLARYEWWLAPHVNPDGEVRNRAWQGVGDAAFDVVTYLTNVVRDVPGDDIEFGFPRHEGDRDARPENRAVFDWWRAIDDPFVLHATLHGMAFAAGPWFLIEPGWQNHVDDLKLACRARTAQLGYTLHDVDRQGEKGFVRLERGFSTRPDSRSMARYFLDRGDAATASQFRPSSMEAIRALSGDVLTVVSEMPLFITPGVGEALGPPDPVAAQWQTRIARWRAGLNGTMTADEVRFEAAQSGLRAMPIRDQMNLQWTLIVAALRQVERTR